MSAPRPILAVLCGELPPYRLHWHRRIAREIPELELRTLLFPIRVPSPWPVPDDPLLGLVRFDPKRPAGAERVNRVRAWDYSDRHPEPASLSLRVRTILAERREMRTLFRWLRAHRPAALLVNGHAPDPASSALVWGKVHRVPTFVWADSNVHDDRSRGWRRLVKQIYVRPLLGMASAILPCGQNGRAYFRRYVSERKPMFECPLEPDYPRFEHVAEERKRAIGARFGLDPVRKRIIVVCRLIALKRVDTILDAFGAIASERPEWDLLIVGDGPQRAALEARVPEALRGRVQWAGFVGDADDLAALYAWSHVLVLASEHEAWALVLNEAAAAGLAIVASHVVGAAPELVREGVNGRTFPVGDAQALANALREVTSIDHLDEMRSASRRVLAEWRARADPIAGLRAALRHVGVLKGA